MARPDGLESATDPTNGLVGHSRGRKRGPLGISNNLVDKWSKTYRKFRFKYDWDGHGAFEVTRLVLYEVKVRGDGSILVNAGDWISKYSDAIHGTPWHWEEYARKDSNGALKPIANVHQLKAGETIYHLPSVPRFLGVVSIREPTLQQKLSRILDHLKNVRHLDDDELKTVADVMKGLEKTVTNADKVLTIAEFIADVTQSSGRISTGVGAAAEAVGAAGVILGFAMIPFQMADLGRKDFGVQKAAAIAATVAYAFDDPFPQPSEYTLKNIASMFPNEIPEYKAKWNKVAKETYSHLKTTAVRQVKAQILRDGEQPLDPELALKIGLRLLAKDDRSVLTKMLAKGYEKK